MNATSRRGLFITFEGGEGSGKSTLARNIFHEFQSSQRKVVLTREPGGTELSDMIRKILLNPEFNQNHSYICHKAELLLYLASRAQHVEEFILPHLQDGFMVLCDRFTDATFAYQGGGRRFKDTQIETLNHFATSGLIPDHTFLVDIEPEVGLSRSRRLNKGESGEGKLDRIEQEGLAFHHNIRETYLRLASMNKHRMTIIHGGDSIEQNLQDALNVLRNLP